MEGAKNGDDIHADETEPLPNTEPQIDRYWGERACRQDFNGLPAVQHIDERYAGDNRETAKRQNEARTQPVPAKPVKHRNGETAAEPQQKDRQGLKKTV